MKALIQIMQVRSEAIRFKTWSLIIGLKFQFLFQFLVFRFLGPRLSDTTLLLLLFLPGGCLVPSSSSCVPDPDEDPSMKVDL